MGALNTEFSVDEGLDSWMLYPVPCRCGVEPRLSQNKGQHRGSSGTTTFSSIFVGVPLA